MIRPQSHTGTISSLTTTTLRTAYPRSTVLNAHHSPSRYTYTALISSPKACPSPGKAFLTNQNIRNRSIWHPDTSSRRLRTPVQREKPFIAPPVSRVFHPTTQDEVYSRYHTHTHPRRLLLLFLRLLSDEELSAGR
ncbi:hypothetical protein CC77DRAFT_50435 [Alternaria alternata]|uniref:Uncharacterized protein n=1 Tax=Alternaria alternata TaxID=5599 RepID=A0A177E4R8_ALTAL|nr:hypothetical protein CC77DRAFT_50435 [Alternaria alternata]KAH6851921.1 hypothetical protein B0T12DRAFT_170998 [Alternaria alternata]OAG26471.1 hypothetical protein CC77DRAFT_50435 [Alternaria alternata]